MMSRAARQGGFSPAKRLPRLCLAVLTLALWLALEVPAPVAGADSPPKWPNLPPPAGVIGGRLPDLQTLPPFDLHVEVQGGRRLLRLANIVWNSGEGMLELAGLTNSDTRQTIVQQRIHTGDAKYAEVVVGEFVYHPGHAHFHFPNFARYELWRLTPRGELDQLAVSSSKVSYCLMETDAVDRDRPDFSTRRRFYECGRTVQGMQVGWGDEYHAALDGQEIDITILPDGFYALVSTANPGRGLLETDYTNNAATVYLHIRASQVILIEPAATPEAELCRPAGYC